MNKINPRGRITIVVVIAILTAVFAYDALAVCGCSVTLINSLATDITISKIKTSDRGIKASIFKTQWVGTRKIKAGGKSNFVFTVDGGCGNEHWFRFVRQDGKECFMSGNCGSTQTCAQDDWR
jgi:hypothetical protein